MTCASEVATSEASSAFRHTQKLLGPLPLMPPARAPAARLLLAFRPMRHQRRPVGSYKQILQRIHRLELVTRMQVVHKTAMQLDEFRHRSTEPEWATRLVIRMF